MQQPGPSGLARFVGIQLDLYRVPTKAQNLREFHRLFRPFLKHLEPNWLHVKTLRLLTPDSTADRLFIRWQAIGWQVIYMGRSRGRRWCALGKEGTGRREQGTGNKKNKGRDGRKTQWPNEPTDCASSRPGMGKVKAREQGEGKREEGMRNRERITNHESRFTDPANIQWPNKAISSQDQGRDQDRPRVASYGGWVGAPGFTSAVVARAGVAAEQPKRAKRHPCESEIRNPQSDQLLSSLSALSSRVSMLKGLLM